MAEEIPMSPITAAEPPKANPLAKPAATHTSTLKLKPVIRKPAAPGTGATQSALRPGLRLPPKPGVATAGLKLPPKPGVATAGLKLPPKPGATVTALRPGVKLPAKPVIRKPGATVTAAPLPKPAAPAAPVAELKPVEPPAAPVAELKPVEPPAAPVAELKPVEPPAAPVVPTKKSETGALDALKVATQSLKSATAPIPAQAILRKTGIIADQSLSEAQKQAAKAKTSRISLSEAMGVAPVKNENAPMKTIRIKRPTDIPGVGAAAKPPAAAVDTQAGTVVAPAAAKPATVTQRKTLKTARPGTGAVRPSGKFGIKKPGMTAAANPALAPTAPASPASAVGTDIPDIPDIPDMPPVAPMPPPAPVAADLLPDVPAGVAVLGVLVQFAACVGMGALACLLYKDALIY